jgi:hypothetical protein
VGGRHPAAVTLPLLLLPDGRVRSRRWRVVAVVAIAATAVEVLAWSVSSGPMTQTIRPVAKPFALGGWAGEAATTVSWIGWAVLFASVPAAAGPLLLAPLGELGLLPEDTFALPMLLSVPVAIAVAVLRYRLWDLDRLVSRTVTYAVVTALLIIPYLLVVPTASRLVEGSGSLAVAAATLTVAALFQPLRRRVQELVDRRFNRRRYDATRTVEGFATRLRDQVDLDALNRELLAVVDQTMQPTSTSLWLRPPATS